MRGSTKAGQIHIFRTLAYLTFSYPTDQSNLQRGVDVVCATPGRLRDLIRRRSISLDKLEFLVLDEADEMLKVSREKRIDQPSRRVSASKILEEMN